MNSKFNDVGIDHGMHSFYIENLLLEGRSLVADALVQIR